VVSVPEKEDYCHDHCPRKLERRPRPTGVSLGRVFQERSVQEWKMKNLVEIAIKLFCVVILAFFICPFYNLIDWSSAVLAGETPKINLEDDPLT
jgi:hypothetical protein